MFAPKWQLALTLLRQVRSAGFTVTAVVGDAECGNNATLRRVLHRAKLPYALGVLSDLHVFVGTPVLDAPAPLTGRGRGDSSPGATTSRPPGAPAFVPSESHQRTIGVRNDDSHPKSSCSANGNWRAAIASGTTWWICRPRHRSVPWSSSPISALRSNSSINSSRTSSDSILSKAAACRNGNAMSS